jgi:hypothetical protein
MRRVSTPLQTSSSRSRRAQTALVLALAAVTCLLVLPASASAKASRFKTEKEAKAYATKVKEVVGFVHDHDQTVYAYEMNFYSDLSDMEPLIGSTDPADQAALATLKQDAQDSYNLYKDEYLAADQENLRELKAFYPSATTGSGRPQTGFSSKGRRPYSASPSTTPATRRSTVSSAT